MVDERDSTWGDLWADLPARTTGLNKDSVVNVSQLLTLDRGFLTEHAGTLSTKLQRAVDEGLRTVLAL